MAEYDLAIIGGGINGAGIARDAAGRGLSVLLVEQNDLASATSSASTKLIHGGLRYLEHGALRLVREALIEREVLLRAAPHLIQPLRFVLPHHPGLRPAFVLRLGLFLYDHLGGRRLLPATRTLALGDDPAGAPLKPEFSRGFEYSDCWVDDARLVVLNAVDAAARGAAIRTRTRCLAATRAGDHWRLTLEARGRREEARARAVVNAAGPFVARVHADVLGLAASARVRLVRGSHIVVPRLFAHERAYIFQGSDGRIVFAIPYETNFTLIGTTDIDHAGDPAAPVATDEEADYLCRTASSYFREPVTPDRIVWRYSGVRPLYDDGASKAKDATRDYVLALDAPEGTAAALTVYGGKITTYRRLAEAALAKLGGRLPAGQAWTATAALPGGDFPWDGVPARITEARGRWPFLDPATAERMVRAYGSRLDRVLGQGTADPGPTFGGRLTAAEIHYLMREEWAETAEDVLWRRTKLGLHLTSQDQEAVARFMGNELSGGEENRAAGG